MSKRATSSQLQQLASIWGARPSLMAILAYFDASGDARQPALGVGGFLGRPEQWSDFERAWKAILDEEGVTSLHMKRFAHSTGEFKGWRGDETRRARFLERLTDVMNRHTLKSIAVVLYLDHYNDFNKVFNLRERLGGPYAFTTWFAMHLATTWRDLNCKGEPISCVVESGDNDQGDLLNTLQRLKILKHYNLTFMEKKTTVDGEVRHHYPFQACDFVAYESGKAARMLEEDTKQGKLVEEMKARRSLLQVMPKQRDKTWRFIDSGLLSEFIRGKFGVKRRVIR